MGMRVEKKKRNIEQGRECEGTRRYVPPCRFRSSRSNVSGFPVLEVDSAAAVGNSAVAASTFIDATSAPMSSGPETLRPERGMKPWFARELRRGHGLRPVLKFD